MAKEGEGIVGATGSCRAKEGEGIVGATGSYRES